jgi:uncharacterized membrane protein
MTVLNNSTSYFSDYYPPSITQHDRMLQTIVDIVPQNASILTQNNIFPHFSSRLNAYVYPVSAYSANAPPDEMDKYLKDIIQKSEFILVDGVTDPATSAAVIEKANAVGAYRTYASADGIYLLKKDYQGDPVFYVP